MIEKDKETKALAKTVQEKLMDMQKKDLDEAVRTSLPFWPEAFDSPYVGPRAVTISGKVTRLIADIVSELASQDMVSISTEVHNLLIEGI